MDSNSDGASLACTDARKRKVSYFYEPLNDYYYGQGHPMKLHCIHQRTEISIPFPAQVADIGRFHTKDYVNDIAQEILELFEVHRRVLDAHHGDGVEEAFYTTDRGMTVPFHKLDKFFPGTGHIKDNGAGARKYYALNVPLSDGLTYDDFRSLFHPIIDKVLQVYQRDAVALQFWADSLGGDRLGNFNVSVKGHGYSVREPCYMVNFMEEFRYYLLKQIERLHLLPMPNMAAHDEKVPRSINVCSPYFIISSNLATAEFSRIVCPFSERASLIELNLQDWMVIGQYTPSLQEPNWFVLWKNKLVMMFNVRYRNHIMLPEPPQPPRLSRAGGIDNIVAFYWGNPNESFKLLLVEFQPKKISWTPYCSTSGWGKVKRFDLGNKDFFNERPQGVITMPNAIWWINVITGRIYLFENVWNNLFNLPPPKIALLGNAPTTDEQRFKYYRNFDCACSIFDTNDSFLILMWDEQEVGPKSYYLFKLGGIRRHPFHPARYDLIQIDLDRSKAILATQDGPGVLTPIGTHFTCGKKIYVGSTRKKDWVDLTHVNEIQPDNDIKNCYYPSDGDCFCRSFVVIL